MLPAAATRRLTNRLGVTLFFVLAIGLVVSMFLKERWLWMDEAISYVFFTDASLAHVNRAVVGGLDASPPLFMNVYWLLGHGISLDPMFLRSVSVAVFAFTAALFYRYLTKLLGHPVLTFLVVTLFICFTYLDFTLATQVRSYAFFGLLHWLFFANSHRLVAAPARRGLLAGHLVLATALAFTHNFGLLFVATMGAFFGCLMLWSKNWAYWRVLAMQALAAGIWLVGWFRNFQVQARAGQPHSWIPLPTFSSFFRTVGELLPTASAHLETSRYFQFLPLLRVGGMFVLIAWLAWSRLRRGYAALVRDPAATLVVQAGFVAVGTTVLTLVVSFTVASVFLSRYMWPNHLLFAAVAVYACHQLARTGAGYRGPVRPVLLSAYALGLLLFVVHQNRKVVLFPSGILSYLPALNPRYPLFFESADYFIPIWFQHIRPNTYFLLDWDAALQSPAMSSTCNYNIIATLRDQYHVAAVVPQRQFTPARFPRFYVVDQFGHYQIEKYLKSGQVRALRILPTAIGGHRILECEFVAAKPLAARAVAARRP